MYSGSYRALAGAQCVHNVVKSKQSQLPDGGRNFAPGPALPPAGPSSISQTYPIARSLDSDQKQGEGSTSEPVIGKVGILGAGCAGIYAAMILESFGIKCEIHESRPDAGGRLHTHYFDPDPAKYQYYDVGAMRYPDIPIMERTFDTFYRTGMAPKLIKYYLDAKDDNTPLFYNNKRYFGSKPPGFDYFHVSTTNGGTVPDEFVKKGVDKVTDAAFKEYKDALVADWRTGWKKLMQQDNHSTRGYMSQQVVIQPPKHDGAGKIAVRVNDQDIWVEAVPGLDYPFDVIQWCETMGSATGLYEEAFSESVMDALDFGWPGAARQGGKTSNEEASVPWYCIDGGGSTFVHAMLKKIPKTQIHYNSRVTGISRVSPKDQNAVTTSVRITTVGTLESPQHTYGYDYVLSSLPLSVLGQSVDTSNSGLDFEQTTAIRALHYDCSVKVGIRFQKQWWRLPEYNITGGVSSTDRPLRTCVYPSYGLDNTDPGTPGVLLVSYTWAQDATRLGALVKHSDFTTRKYPEEKELIDLLFRDLVSLHGMQDEKFLRDLYIEHYAHNWFDDPHSVGAFALFGAGQFTKMYPSLARPAALNPRLHLIGEATSVHHAWVVGALNSAWRGVYNMLRVAGCTDEDSRIKRLKERPWDVDITSESISDINEILGYNDKNWGPPPEEVGLVTDSYVPPVGHPVVHAPTEKAPGYHEPSRGIPSEDLNVPPPKYFFPPSQDFRMGQGEWWEMFTPGRGTVEA